MTRTTGNETRVTRAARLRRRDTTTDLPGGRGTTADLPGGRGTTTDRLRKHGTATGDVTRLRQPGWLPFAFAAFGTGAGFAATLLARWLVSLPRAPFKGPAELLTSLPEPWPTLGPLVGGAVLGLLAGLVVLHDELSVRVDAAEVTLTRAGEPSTFARAQLAAAFRDGKDLVLLAPDGAELARERCDFPERRLGTAFARHGHRWTDHDPHAADFRLWVPDTPGLPAGADALLKARAKALTRSDSTAAEDRRELRAELARLGVYVRDEKRRQYWRGRAGSE
ncbi:hypothetical protein QIS99_08260 [Streptomyces sp. B-S-A8]|uniref:DUF308 domain-containing protein n=1 Tax=Streptomyces solicavernae TaxID=3043614 RepID=A0ABT6RP49_9ACTN|nr:hypothetical protein [Streptomyces sp. B-S-A8]MDI3386206.1 hypothetical protein [Streptomyces sp. B-S-A8]